MSVDMASAHFSSIIPFFFPFQTLPANLLKNTVTVDLLYEGFKYTVRVTKTGPIQYLVELNGSVKEVEVHHMTDEQGRDVTVRKKYLRAHKKVFCQFKRYFRPVIGNFLGSILLI